jgi:capsular polysaccharide transport system permease protein
MAGAAAANAGTNASGDDRRWGLALRNQLNVFPAVFFRESESRQGRSFALGYLASGIEPLLVALVLAILFSVLSRNAPYGRSLMLFLATGVFPIYLFIHTSLRMRQSVGLGKRRVRYPLERPLDHVFVNAVLHLMTSSAMAVLFFGGLYLLGVPEALPEKPLVAFEALLTVFLLGLGMGLTNSVIVRILPIWDVFWPVVVRLALHFSGLFYVVAFLPPNVRGYFAYNPLLHGTNWFRHAFYPFYPDLVSNENYVLMWAFSLFTFGLLLEAGTRNFLEAKE